MSEGALTNEEKRQVYATLKTKLKVALHQEFYLEALLLEYSIVEDRLSSILEHSGISYRHSNGEQISIQKKLDKISNAIRCKKAPICLKVRKQLLDDVTAWKNERNAIVHQSCQRIYDSEEVKNSALTGNELVRNLTNTARAVKTAAEKGKR